MTREQVILLAPEHVSSQPTKPSAACGIYATASAKTKTSPNTNRCSMSTPAASTGYEMPSAAISACRAAVPRSRSEDLPAAVAPVLLPTRRLSHLARLCRPIILT